MYLKEYKHDIILLKDSPDIHLEKLILSLKPHQIIADGSNYNSYVKRWENTAKAYDIPFHSTYYNGAKQFILP